MQRIERLFFQLFPLQLLKATLWCDVWEQKERSAFFRVACLFFPIVGVAYIAHYYTIDHWEGVAPSELWFNYRYAMAAMCFSVWYFYQSKKLRGVAYYKIPAIVSIGVLCFFEARTIVWYPKVPYLFAFCFVYIGVRILKMSILNSCIVAFIYIVSMWDSFMMAKLSPSMMYSSSLVTIIAIISARSTLVADIKNFILNNEKLDVQKKNIEMNMEFTEQIKAFLPKEISKRMDSHIAKEGMSIAQAINEVLRPQTRPVACLFSDIRGYTKLSKNLDNFVHNSAIPNIKTCVAAVEEAGGIPRTIGDLVFAYYDNSDYETNLIKALSSAISLYEANIKMNQHANKESQVDRHILVSTGEAVVGNLGGHASSREITAMGSPVNILDRIDQASKDQRIKRQLGSNEVILTSDAAKVLKKSRPLIQLKKIDLNELEIVVRDFPDESEIWLMPINIHNKNQLFFDLDLLKELHGELPA